MFALVRYDNRKYYVIPKNHVLFADNCKCIVKIKGCRYKASLIAYNCKFIDIHIVTNYYISIMY